MDLSKFFETSSQIQKINTKLEWQQTFFKLGYKQIHNLSKGTCWEKIFSCVKLSEISFFFFLWEELSEKIFFFSLSLCLKKYSSTWTGKVLILGELVWNKPKTVIELVSNCCSGCCFTCSCFPLRWVWGRPLCTSPLSPAAPPPAPAASRPPGPVTWLYGWAGRTPLNINTSALSGRLSCLSMWQQITQHELNTLGGLEQIQQKDKLRLK